MMWGYYDGWSWLWMAALMLLFWGAIVALAVFAIRNLNGRPRHDDGALEILRRRFAAGEIGPEEFEKSRRTLQG